jgi:hypothetical protein
MSIECDPAGGVTEDSAHDFLRSGVCMMPGTRRISRPRWLPALACALVVLASSATADEVTLESARDNTLFEDAQGDTSNGSGPSVFAGRNSQGRVRRALIWFDVHGLLPAGAIIDSATLQLHLASSSDPSPRVIRVHRILVAWGEGASESSGGSGGSAQEGDATWLHAYFPGVFWITPGGDFSGLPSASTTVDGEGHYRWSDAQLTADIQAWLAAGEEHGWILIGDETLPGTARRFDSREHTTPEQRPRLTLHYSMPTPTVPQTWGQLKYHYR